MTSTRIELSMNGILFLVLVAVLASPPLVPAAHAVTLRASRTTVSGAGETATICVDLETEGEQVAGTQNELVWDTSCATLSGLSSCRASSGHGKDLRASFPNGDGLPPLRAFVFSMRNVDPMPDTELYCCDFTSELVDPGSCTVSVQGARASDPNGRALAATGVSGAIVLGGAGGGGVGGSVSGGLAGGAATGGGATGGGATGGGATGGGATGGGATGGGATGASGGVATGLGQPPSQVLPGGVVGEQEQPADTEALAQAAREAARNEAERIVQRQVPAEEEPVGGEAEVVEPEAESTEEPTLRAAPPTSPMPQPTTPARGTPTAKAPTAGRTPAAPAAAAEAPKKKESSSWFGCQIATGGGSDGSIFLLIGAVGLLVSRVRRRGRRRG